MDAWPRRWRPGLRVLADALVDVAELVAADRSHDPFGFRHQIAWTLVHAAAAVYVLAAGAALH